MRRVYIRGTGTRAGGHVDAHSAQHSMQQLYAALKLSSFSDDELARAFKSADTTGSGKLSRSDVRALLLAAHGAQLVDAERERAERVTDAVMQRFTGKLDGTILPTNFLVDIKRIASQRDSRVWPIAGMMLVAGIAVGVVLPVMPLLVQSLGLSSAEYGNVIASFGFAKLLSNVPSAMMVTRLGRRATMSIGLGVVGVGMLGVGCAVNLPMLVSARLVTGVGVSALLAGATMAVADISTPLNRARMMAPMTTAFSAGTVLGPAVGGLMSSWLGVSATFFSVSAIFFANALGTRLLTADTMPTAALAETATRTARPAEATPVANGTEATPVANGTSAEFQRVVSQWRPLWADPRMRGALLLNACYWASLAGTSMTLLPLILTDPSKFGLAGTRSAAHARAAACACTHACARAHAQARMHRGDCRSALRHASRDLCRRGGSGSCARRPRRSGPRLGAGARDLVRVHAFILVHGRARAHSLAHRSLGMVSFSLSTDLALAAASMGVWAIGSTVLGSAPTANAANLVAADVRPQVATCSAVVATCGAVVATAARSLQHAARSLQHAARSLQHAARSLQHAACCTAGASCCAALPQSHCTVEAFRMVALGRRLLR
jgi:MFS family permease